MYNEYIKYSYPMIGEENILKLESDYKVNLPKDYREFLKFVNGGRCLSDDLQFDDTSFFPIEESSPFHLGSMIYEERHGNHIPIAQTLNADLIYLDLCSGEICLLGKVIAKSIEDFVLYRCKKR